MEKENNISNEPEIIKVIGEHNEEIFMKLLEIVNVENQDYALLSVVDENNSSDEEDEVVIMKMVKTDDECTFEIIESDEEFNTVVEAISEDDIKKYDIDEDEVEEEINEDIEDDFEIDDDNEN